MVNIKSMEDSLSFYTIEVLILFYLIHVITIFNFNTYDGNTFNSN